MQCNEDYLFIPWLLRKTIVMRFITLFVFVFVSFRGDSCLLCPITILHVGGLRVEWGLKQWLKWPRVRAGTDYSHIQS